MPTRPGTGWGSLSSAGCGGFKQRKRGDRMNWHELARPAGEKSVTFCGRPRYRPKWGGAILSQILLVFEPSRRIIMKWEQGQESGNLEDRRRIGPKTIGGGLGMLVILVIGYFLGVDPQKLAQLASQTQVGQ